MNRLQLLEDEVSELRRALQRAESRLVNKFIKILLTIIILHFFFVITIIPQNETDRVAGNMKRELEIEKELEDVNAICIFLIVNERF